MYISKIRVENYKSFLDSHDIHFEPGINIITGQNNGGKSALLRAASMQTVNQPHISTITKPDSIVDINKLSTVDAIIRISGLEFLKYVKSNADSSFILNHSLTVGLTTFSNLNKSILDESFFNKDEMELLFFREHGEIKEARLIYSIGKNMEKYSTYLFDKKRNRLVLNNSDSQLYSPGTIEIVKRLIKRFYLFKAERLNIGVCLFGTNTELKPDAQNLPEVLDNLQRTKARFQKYHDYVKIVLPQIAQFTVNSKEDKKVEIVVWNDPNSNERMDLAIPLSECGTGVSQVMAILYVVLTADLPQVIIIDEPNSFLHPGAARKLIEILKEFPQHQYIISTHSPEIIAAANPKTIHIVRMENAQSIVEPVDISDAKNQQLYLAEIGVKLSDVFGADNILWVEGPTEEICFKNIIDKTEGLSLQGTAILGVKNTGDFEGKKTAQTTFDVYRKLSTGAGLMPPAIGFIFDLEEREEKEKAEMRKQAKTLIVDSGRGRLVDFLGRRMFENYLLNAEAIAAVLNELGEDSITSETIEDWIEKHKSNVLFKANKAKGDDWRIHIDAAKLLNKMFSDLTDARISYSKTIHSVALCDWLLENKPEALAEIVDILKGFLQPENANKTGKGAGTKKA